MTTKLTVEVTADHIRTGEALRGQRNASKSCMVWQALRPYFGHLNFHVHTSSITLADEVGGFNGRITSLPEFVCSQIGNFDNACHIDPFSFEVFVENRFLQLKK